MITAVSSPISPKYNLLFLPGMPGKVKQFDIFDDVVKTGGKVHWLQYSGTYDAKDVGRFSIDSSAKDIINALEELSREDLPIVIAAYSYSTAILKHVNLAKYTKISGLALFSPIQGLNEESINEVFSETIQGLIDSREISANASEWSDSELLQKDSLNYEDFLHLLCGNGFPVMIAYSTNDTVIKVDTLREKLSHFRASTSYNSVLVFEQDTGHHRLDSYYDTKIGNFFRALEIEFDLMKILDNDIFIYFWGSSLNYNYSGLGSDIDLLIFYEGYLDKYKELNAYVEAYNNSHSITFDLSINNKSDLLSKKIFRYNRGPVAIHELQYAYFPLKRATKYINLEWSDVVNDAYNASLILSGESKKILSKCDIRSDRVKKIVKYSITVFTYLQYIRGTQNLDLNHVEDYLQTTDPFYKNIKRSIELKKQNYRTMSLGDLYDAVKGIDLMIDEQERLIGIA